MIQEADAIIALAGGIGTLDELIEVITLKQLGQFAKPVIILNTNHFFDPLLEQLRKMVDEGFMRQSHADLWHVVHKAGDVVPALHSLLDTGWESVFSAQV